ncbi:hypothetical protein Gotri_018740 [Gossypium trilobum]|uniref:Uncharacterized protein n=1 Tax=Gossypium trilobum TaxID=34281 RepID=A0A7J9EAZ3_9ROSI|nr:hypothetical protein [Gossypium trilobum]
MEAQILQVQKSFLQMAHRIHGAMLPNRHLRRACLHTLLLVIIAAMELICENVPNLFQALKVMLRAATSLMQLTK